ncbi:allatostatin-A receptor-like [Apostichopus japonicus]|uniref:allatostatin-A receptor-like n=1 Tax=Stichopus japonicus TaxID=307972 RepID=UPI003AB46FF6
MNVDVSTSYPEGVHSTYLSINVVTTPPVADIKQSVLRVLFVLIGIVGTFGNALVCIVISSALRKKPTTTNFLILNQAFVDLCTSIQLILLYTFSGIAIPEVGPWGEFLCRFWFSSTLLWMLFVVSTYNLVMLCLERFIAVALPLYYNARIKRKSALYMILFCWIVAPFVHFYYPIFFDYNENGICMKHLERRSAFIMGFVIIVWEFFVPFVLMSVLYICIMAALRHQQRRVHGTGHLSQNQTKTKTEGQMASLAVPQKPISLVSSSSKHPSGQGDSNAPIIVTSEQPMEASTNSSSAQASSSQGRTGQKQINSSQRLRRNLTFTLLAVFVMFGLCWLPNHMTFFLFSIGKAQLGTTWHDFTLVLAYMNMSVNPFIYAWKYRQFQQGFKAIFYRHICGRKTNDTEVVGYQFSHSSATYNNREASTKRKYGQSSPMNLPSENLVEEPAIDLLSNDVINHVSRAEKA